MKRILLSLTIGILLCAVVPAQEMTFEQRARIFDYDAKAPLDVKEKGVEEVEGVLVHDLTYTSPKGGEVPAYLVTPRGKGPFAAILFMHWGQGDRTEFLSEAVACGRAGAVSLMIDAPYNRPGYQGGAFFVEPEKEREMYIQLVVDLRRSLDLLLARPDVDPKRLGYVGHSLGATWGGALAGVDHRASAFVLMGGLPSLTDFPEDDSYAAFIRSRFSKEQVQKYVDTISAINPEHFAGRAAPGAILFQFAKHDRYISERSAVRYEKAAGQPQQSRRYFTSHEFNDPEALRDRAEWLRMKLGLGPMLARLRVTPPAAEALCAQSEQMLFAKVGGKPVAYHVLGTGTGTPLLLINGGPGYPHTSLHLSAAWEPLAQGRRVIFFDQPGTGQSWPLGADDSLVVADVLASIEAIRQAIGAPQLAVLGHSWGGYVALAYAIHHPEHVQAVVLVGSVPPKIAATESLDGARFPERIAAEKNLDPNNPADADTWTRGRMAMSFYSAEVRDRVLAQLAGCPFGYVGRQETLLWKDAESLDLSDDLPRLARPLLVMAGRYDGASPRTAWKIHQAVPGSQYAILERSGHFPMIEEPDEFAAVVDRFLRGAK